MDDEQAQATEAEPEVAAVQASPLSYGELKKRQGVHEFTLTRPADDPRGKVRYLELHGGRFKMERGKSRVFKFSLPAEAKTLAQLSDDGYTVEEGGPPDPEAIEQQTEPELADAFANRAEIAPQSRSRSQGAALGDGDAVIEPATGGRVGSAIPASEGEAAAKIRRPKQSEG